MSLISSFIDLFVDSGAIMLVISGFMALVWFFYEGIRRGFIKPKNESWERDRVSTLLKGIILFGLILGMITIITAIMTMVMNMPPSFEYRDNVNPGYGDHFDWLTSISLLVMGIAMFLKPLEDVPLASLIGLIAGAVAALLISILIPASLIEAANGYVNMKWVLFGVFAVVATLVGVSLKFWVGSLETISKIISWPPIALITAAYCLAQGFMIWFTGQTLILF